MKRSISASGNKASFQAVAALLFGASILGACSREPAAQTADATTRESNWTQTPMIQSVEGNGAALQIAGQTAPQGRVVLRGRDGPAYATTADAAGRFSLTIDKPATDALFDVEARRGEESAHAPFQMLVARDPSAPTALLAEGAPSRRLTGGGLLDVVDSDGQALLATGRAAPEAVVTVTLAGSRPVRTRTDGEGRWSAVLSAEGAGPAVITVDDRSYSYPGPGGAPATGEERKMALDLTPAGQGWRVTWSLPSTAWQSAWFPDD